MDHWDQTTLPLFDSDPAASTAELRQLAGFTFEASDNGICTIQSTEKITPDVIAAVGQYLVRCISQHGLLPAAVLLDVRTNNHLSIVRLSSLIDTISALGWPLAVVFREPEQQALADLLHNTLAQKDGIAYFTDPAEAHAYLNIHARTITPPQLQ